ncbi:MAG: VanW family protein [Caldilineaceae bacterium]|nr:VanW family protein [Caldilineaceae bacterium]MDE0336287.1 VanW family protein [Caldilineaceae bacterium]
MKHLPGPIAAYGRPPSGVEYLLIWICVACVAVAGVFAGWQFWHTDRIFSGVRVAGVPVGGETRASALLRLHRELTPYPLAPVYLELGPDSPEGGGAAVATVRRWALGAELLAPEADLEGAVKLAYHIGRQGGLFERTFSQWQAFSGRKTVWPEVFVSEGVVRQAVGNAASEVRRPSRPAIQIGELSLPARPGLDVDIGATAHEILTQVASGQTGTVSLQTYSTAPPESAAAEPSQNSAGAGPSGAEAGPAFSGGSWAAEPVVLRHEPSGTAFALDAAQLQKIMPGGDPGYLNEEALRFVVEGWANQVSFPAQDARLRFDDATSALTVLQPSRAGQRLNVDLTIESVRRALTTDERTGTLPIISIAPAVDSSRLGELGIRELVASGTTYFKGSSSTRVYNIEVAADKLIGVVVPPGGVFSFNSAIEAVSGANGFEDSAIIWGDRTAVGVGGGVCQVSTTVFRAALEGGFPFLERHNHGYVVSWYGDPGFDATIYTPYVDLRFLNDTDAHLLIQPVVDGVEGVLSFRFYGTRPDRKVEISEAVYEDKKQPGEPIYQEDASLEAGQIKQVEWAKEGLTATVIRKVTQNGVTREEAIRSVYRPWNAMYLYGPGTVIPGVTDVEEPTPAPATEESSGGDG